MKICYSNPTVLMKRPVAQIAELASKKHKVSILVPRKIKKKRNKDLHYSDVKVKFIDYPTLSPPLESEFPIPTLKFFVEAHRALRDNDVIHMWVPNYLSNTWIALMKLLFFREKTLILTMDTVPGYSFKFARALDIGLRIYHQTFGRIIVYPACDKITLYADSLKKYAKKAGIPSKKIEITPTGIDLKVKPKSKNIKKEFGIKNEKIIMYAGLMVHRKGIDTIIKVAERLPDAKFILLGDGPRLKEYKALVKKKRIENIIFTGFRKDIENFFHAADIFFFPSRGEGLPGAVMEAMAYGVPVVSSDISCTNDLIKKNENGLLCATEAVDCYEVAIKKLLNSKKLRETFATKSKAMLKKHYNWNTNIKKFLKLYANINK